MNAGFQLRSLRVTGRGKKPAEIDFRPGCNVISGASNTGKSYILQCIDYAFGSQTKPKVIDESLGYDTVVLEFEESVSSLEHRFERSLRGGAVRHSLRTDAQWLLSPVPLGQRHSSTDPNTVSGTLLKASGLWGNKVRTNNSGRVDSLSFRDVTKLILVDEKAIIEDRSPMLSGQSISETKELSVFNLLLTGVDDSSVVAQETQGENRARRRAQLELLDRLIAQNEAQIRNRDTEPASAGERRLRVDQAIAAATESAATSQHELSQLEAKRHEAWTAAQHASARGIATEQLRGRFRLLEEHYKNDIQRLNAVIEADHYFTQLQQVRCPLCGAERAEPHVAAHTASELSALSELRAACQAELQKIQSLLRELLGTTGQLDVEISEWKRQEQQQMSLFETATAVIERDLSPRAASLQTDLADLIERRDHLAHLELLQERLAGLQKERVEIASAVWRARPLEGVEEKGQLVPQAVERFTLAVQSVLEEWNYPNLTRVTFNTERRDLIISGKDRASEGKGFRAIAYSAFIVGLLRYCAAEGRAHPGLVVLDSPLVTYKRRDTKPGEEIPEDVGRAFYQALANTPGDQQIVILENEDPPAEVQERVKYTHFSRSSDVGRSGFFPKDS